MKKVILGGIALLSIVTLAACATSSKNTSSSSTETSSEQLKTLDKFAKALEKELDRTEDTKVFMEDNHIVVQLIKDDFTGTPDDEILRVSNIILEIKHDVFKNYKAKDLAEPLLMFRDQTDKTYAIESEDGEMGVIKAR